MSTITPLQPLTATQPLWVPALPTLYRLSIAQYEAMVAFGVFTKRDRLHLINGFLVAKMTEYPPHAAACDGVRFAIEALLATGWYVRSDKPLKIPNCISVPEPDVVVARGTWRDYNQSHPEPSQAPLVVEVSSSSLLEDRRMALVYGRGGVAVYWIVNLIGSPGRGPHRSWTRRVSYGPCFLVGPSRPAFPRGDGAWPDHSDRHPALKLVEG